jgi:hypothetical protein
MVCWLDIKGFIQVDDNIFVLNLICICFLLYMVMSDLFIMSRNVVIMYENVVSIAWECYYILIVLCFILGEDLFFCLIIMSAM